MWAVNAVWLVVKRESLTAAIRIYFVLIIFVNILKTLLKTE